MTTTKAPSSTSSGSGLRHNAMPRKMAPLAAACPTCSQNVPAGNANIDTKAPIAAKPLTVRTLRRPSFCAVLILTTLSLLNLGRAAWLSEQGRTNQMLGDTRLRHGVIEPHAYVFIEAHAEHVVV